MKENYKMPLRVEALDVEITSLCNLGCSYCYVGIGKLNKTGMAGDMTDEIIEDTLNLIDKFGFPKPCEIKLPNGKTKKQEATKISFYGGEPMLSWERVHHFIERAWCRGMDLQFSILSNGTTGTQEQVNWLNKHNIWTQRSIDGYPEAQEKYRPNSIELYKEKNKIWKDFKHSRRMTVQPEFAKDLLKSQKFFEEMGFMEGTSPMPNYYTEWTQEQVDDFKKSLWDLGKYYLERWKAGTSFYNYYLTREMTNRFMNPSQNQQFGCGGGNGLHCVSWDGQVYLCHRFSKESRGSEYHFGSLKEVLTEKAKGYSDKVYKRVWQHLQNEKEWDEKCKGCIARYGCEKGCMHTSFKCTGKIDKVPKIYCEIRIESAKVITWLDSQLRTTDADWWAKNNHLARNYLKNKNKKQQGKCDGKCETQNTGGCGVDMCQEYADGTRIKVQN